MRADHCRCLLIWIQKENSLVPIHDVARVARTSTATVSQTLNRPKRVAAKTRRRVLAAIRKLKYYPNLNTRILASRVSRTFGIIVSDIQNPFFGDAIRSFEARAHHWGNDSLIMETNHPPVDEAIHGTNARAESAWGRDPDLRDESKIDTRIDRTKGGCGLQ